MAPLVNESPLLREAREAFEDLGGWPGIERRRQQRLSDDTGGAPWPGETSDGADQKAPVDSARQRQERHRGAAVAAS